MGQGIPEIEIAMDERIPSASAKSNRRPSDRYFQRFKEDHAKEIAEAQNRGNRYQSDGMCDSN